jgi:hypothetical protein
MPEVIEVLVAPNSIRQARSRARLHARFALNNFSTTIESEAINDAVATPHNDCVGLMP